MQTRIIRAGNGQKKWAKKAKKETHSSLSVPPTYVCSSRPKTTYAWQAGTQGIQSVQCRVPGGKEMGREELCHANSTYARCQGVRLLVPQTNRLVAVSERRRHVAGQRFSNRDEEV